MARFNPYEVSGGFKGTDYLYAELFAEPHKEVAPDIEVKIASVLRVAKPSSYSWVSVHIVFALREIIEREGKQEQLCNDFKPLEVKGVFTRSEENGMSLVNFEVKGIKYPKVARFRAEVRIQVTLGNTMLELGKIGLQIFQNMVPSGGKELLVHYKN